MTETLQTLVRADAIHQAFAQQVSEAAARAIGIESTAMLKALGGSGRPAGERGELRARFVELAEKCFPTSSDPSRKLLRLCRGEATPRPLWEDLAQLEAGLGVCAVALFGEPSVIRKVVR